MNTATHISSRSDFFGIVPGGPVFRLAEARGLLTPGASVFALCRFFEEHRSEVDAHLSQLRRERALRNLPAQRRNLTAQ